MEVQVKKMREQFTVAELENNYYEVINMINGIVKEKDWEITIDGEKSDLIYVKPNFNDLSKNARKNIAKRLHYINKKKSRKTINTLFFIARRLDVIDEKVYISLGKKEKEIQRLKSIYKIMRTKTEEARLAYNTEKGDFYKKGVV
tara:strand:- start:973 stop:1407 length:435 start_codon:yes stop_codon:yes gene_type:complete